MKKLTLEKRIDIFLDETLPPNGSIIEENARLKSDVDKLKKELKTMSEAKVYW